MSRIAMHVPSRRRRNWPDRYPRGYSFSEVLIVVLLIGILTAVSAPRWIQSLQQRYANNAAARIVADVARVQSRAYSTSTNQAITFDASGNFYTIAGLTDPDHPTAVYTVRLDASPYSSRIVTISLPGAQPLTFNGFGLPVGLPAAGGTIVVASGDYQRTIIIDPKSGAAVIQ